MAANQVKYYQKVIIPLVNKFDKQIEKINCPKYEGEIKTFSRDDLFEDRTWLKSWVECVSKNNPDIQVLNSLEAFATYFTSKMANEKIAFYATGETFCRTVEKLFPFIAINITLDHQYYINIRDLYQIWSKRIKKEKLQNQVKERLFAIDEIEEKNKSNWNKIKIFLTKMKNNNLFLAVNPCIEL